MANVADEPHVDLPIELPEAERRNQDDISNNEQCYG
jgi:hypothetical protein